MNNTLKTLIVAATAIAAFATVSTPGAQAREYCKSKIKVVNNTRQAIKIYKVDFYDYQAKKWRIENLKNKKMGPGHTHTERANLTGVAAEKVWLELRYRYLKGNGRWSKMQKSKGTNVNNCRDGATQTIAIR